MLHVDLSELAGGELQAKFDREITKVIENMKDPNTPYQEARSVTIKISLKQTELRDDAKVDYGKQIPGQMAFTDIDPAELQAESQTEGKKITSMPRALRANG